MAPKKQEIAVSSQKLPHVFRTHAPRARIAIDPRRIVAFFA
jgi:hypothetical protein